MVTYSTQWPSRLASVWRSNSTSWVKADLFFHKALSEFFKDRLKIKMHKSPPKKQRSNQRAEISKILGRELFSSRNDWKNEPNVILKYKIFLFGCHFFKLAQTNLIFFSQTNLNSIFFSPNKPFLSVAMNIVKRQKTLCRLHFK